jgi:methionine sulfoxide reductase heme-binding subunit
MWPQAAVFGGEPSAMLGAAQMAKDSKQPWQVWLDRRGRVSWLRVAVLVILLLPAAKALIEANAIAYSARPLNELIHRTGFWALMFLGLAFAITPLRRILRYGPLIDVRRMIGVASFIYIAAHLSLFFADQSYSFAKFFTEITKRVYLIIGAFAWTGLAVLAATSTDAMVRRLGGMRWRRLHQLIYLISLLALIHYFQQTKADVSVPTFTAAIFAWLMAYRVVGWWQGRAELSTLMLLLMTSVVAAVTLVGEVLGIALVFNAPISRILPQIWDFEASIRPGWQVLGAGLIVVVVDFIRARIAKPSRTAAQPA